MNLQQALENQQLKKKLLSRKEEKIKQRLIAKQRQKVNLDQSHLKSGKMQKTKTIQKKVYKTEVQKARKIEVQVQQNENASTYVGESQQYLTILNRTKNKILFQNQKLSLGCKAISAYATQNKQKLITIQLTMQNPIQCNECPVMLKLVYPQQNSSCIVLTNQKQQIQAKAINDADMRIMDVKQFATKYKTDKKFKKQVSKKMTKLFADFKIFANSKLVKRLTNQNIIVFPIDVKKVPYSLQQQTKHYKQYLRLLLNSSYAITKSGSQHRIKIHNQDPQQMKQNIEYLVHQMVARLIQRNKNKGNKLVSVRLKTQSSIPIDIYG